VQIAPCFADLLTYWVTRLATRSRPRAARRGAWLAGRADPMMEGVPPSLVGAVEPEPEPEPEPELALPEPEVGALSLWIPTGGATSLASRTAAPAVALRSRLAESLLEPAAQRLAFAGILNHRLGADSVATLRTTAVDADVLGKVGAVALQATSDTGCVDLDAAIALLKQGKLLSERQVKALCKRTKNVLMNEENVQRVPAPVTICGDLRGHFYELLNLFEIGGEVPSTNYLFLGKYIGRGCHQLLTFLLLIALKARWPCRVYLCRGSQESRQMTQVYGFYDECLRAYGTSEVWRCCMDVCDALTLSYVVEHHIFCVHGGLSPSVDTFSDIRSINRFQDVEPDGPMCDMLWSDPEDIAGW
jgi:hypothetical protein